MRGLTFSGLSEIDVLEWNNRLFHFNTRQSTLLILPFISAIKYSEILDQLLFQISRFLIVCVVMDNTSKIVRDIFKKDLIFHLDFLQNHFLDNPTKECACTLATPFVFLFFWFVIIKEDNRQ